MKLKIHYTKLVLKNHDEISEWMPHLFRKYHSCFFNPKACSQIINTNRRKKIKHYDNHFSLFAEPNMFISMTTYLFYYQIAALIPVKS